MIFLKLVKKYNNIELNEIKGIIQSLIDDDVLISQTY